MITRNSNRVLLLAELSLEGAAMNEAALAGDFDEARFRASLLRAKAAEAGLTNIAAMARIVETSLGKPGMEPGEGYGEAMLRLANLISQDPGFAPL
ncbi:MAG: hypothetical protein ACTHOL_19650 [Luteibacter jiangsuensis]